GKISVCNNLRQYGIRYSLTDSHTIYVSSEEFKRELLDFLSVCRVVRGLRRARIGAIGARPNAFNTTRYSEKLLEATGISVSTLDLSDLFGKASSIPDGDVRVKERIEDIAGYASIAQVPGSATVRMAKLAVVLLDWMDQND